jgi:glycosyltransferase involved in cell wall biosynthesis
MREHHNVLDINEDNKDLYIKESECSEIILYVNRLSKRLGGSYLSNNDLQADLAHYGNVKRILLLDDFWKNKELEKIPYIEEQKIIFKEIWEADSIPDKNQIINMGSEICNEVNEVINNGKKSVIILGHESLLWLAPILKRKLNGTRICVIHHGTPTHSLEELGSRFKMKFIKNLGSVDFIIAVAPHLSEIISSIVDKKVITLPNFPKLPEVSVRIKSKSRGNEVHILQISTMREVKRPLDGLELLSQLSRNEMLPTLTFLGNGELLEKYTKLALSDMLNGTIRFIPFANRTEVAELLISHDFLFLPSAKEGFPRVIVESMLCGRPVVISSGANVCQLINNGQNGLIFQTGAIEEAASKIVELHSDEEKYKAIVRNGNRTIEFLRKWRKESIRELLQIIEIYMPEWRCPKW